MATSTGLEPQGIDARVTGIDERVTAALRERGQRVTPQRLVIARVAAGSLRHLTAEAVYAEVRELLPGISLPTVYATLELLEELTVIRRVATESGSVVYDSRDEPHDHLVCRACGAIADVESSHVDRDGLLEAAWAQGFIAQDAQVIVRGLCADCRRRTSPQDAS